MLTFFYHQLDAQNSCLFTHNTLIKILYMFRALPCSSSGGLRRNCIYAASGIVIIYLRIIHLLISCTCFEHYPAHLQEVYVVIVYMQYLVSLLCAGDCLVHRLRKNCSAFLTGVQDSHLQRVTIPEAAHIQLRRRPSEDEQGNARNM